jgi:DNA-binding MarR family transcriptional regulator
VNEWIALRKVLDGLESDTNYGSLDPLAQRVLEWVYVRSKSNDPLFVQEIITDSRIASPATLHKCIASLKEQGLLDLSIDPSDARRRVVAITSLSDRVMADLSKGVRDWAGSFAPNERKSGKV